MATEEHPEPAGRRRFRIALVVCCVLTVVLAALLVPMLASDDLAGTPIDTVLPGERFDESGGGAIGSGSSFGALNPGDQTGVGGDTGFDNETFGSNDTEVHFRVESTEPSYWRTGSYDTYTGTGWERNTDTDAYDPPLTPVGLTDGTLEFEVTLTEPATAIPAAWQPAQVTGVDAESLAVTEDGALRSERPLQPGTTVTGVSQLQENDISVLRSAGESYPDDLFEQYTQLPDDTPDRVEEFTADLVEDDETPYDAAVTVQNWLRSEKGYSLQADEQSDSIADTFIFEMEEGYCEYFATAMTTMLRSQDIPARYAVGYTTGQPVGDSTYEVRGMNAHAWVEVYFPDVGWVQFEPTPGDSRLEMESTVLEEELDEDHDALEPGSPGEQLEPGNITGPEDPTDEDENENDTEEGFDISLNQTAVPGTTAEITVTEDGEPASSMLVTVNDEDVGVTDRDGTVAFTVPEADELEIGVTEWGLWEGDVEVVDEWNGTQLDAVAVPTGGQHHGVGSERVGSTAQLERSDWEIQPERVDFATLETNGVNTSSEPVSLEAPERQERANTTVPVETEATLTTSGDILPGETITVTAVVRDVTITDAVVTLDGEEVATTDESGRANVTLPEESGNVTVAVERGSVFGEERLALPTLELTVETGVLELPFTTATATVSADERNVSGAPVVVNGEQVARTSASGTAEFRLPLSEVATVETSMYGLSDGETVDGLVWNAGVVAAGVLLFVAVPAGVVYRRGHTVGTALDAIRSGVSRRPTPQRALLTVVRGGGRVLGTVSNRIRATLVYAFDTLRGKVTPGELWTLFLAWVRSKRRVVERVFGVGDVDGQPRAVDVETGIRRAWAQFLSHVSVSDPERHTPAELAAHAIDVDDLPAETVETVVAAFREVEYGSRPEHDRLARVERALEQLDSDHETDGGGT